MIVYNYSITASYTKFAVPSVKAKNVKGQKTKVSIGRIEGADGYQIQYSTSKTFSKKVKKVTISDNLTKSTTLKKLSKTTYYVRIRATYASGAHSDWSKAVKVKIKK